MSPAGEALLGELDLDDAAAVADADRGGLLPGIASAGAQVRAAAADVDAGALERLRSHGVRSVVLLARSGPAARAARLVVAASAARVGTPVVHLTAAPRWLGALDVVVVLTDDAGDLALAADVALAVRRGAEVVLAAPTEGPVAAAGGGRVVAVPPRIPVPEGLELVRFAATATGVLAAVTGADLPPLDLLADALDRDAARTHPSVDVVTNPAKALAVRVHGRAVVLAADDAAALVVAAHAAEHLLARTGRPAGAVELPVAVTGSQVARALASPGSAGPVDPLFHDPLIDGPAPRDPVRVLLVSAGRERGGYDPRSAALPDAETVAVDRDDLRDSAPALAGDALAELLLLVPRLEAAAVLAGLVEQGDHGG